MKEKDLDDALHNPNKFYDLFKSLNDITHACHQSALYKAKLTKFISDYPVILERYANQHTEYLDMLEFIRLFPSPVAVRDEIKEIICGKKGEFTRRGKQPDYILQALSNAVDFKRLFTSTFDLMLYIKKFPDHAEAIMSRVLNNPQEFERLFPNSEMLAMFVTQPQFHFEVIQKISNQESVKKYFKDGKDFIEILERVPVPIGEPLLDQVISDEELYKKCFPNIWYVKRLIQSYPKSADMCLLRLLSSEAEFKHYINDNCSLCYGGRISNRFASAIISRVSSNPQLFQKLIKDESELKSAADVFKNEPVLKAKNVMEALELVIEKKKQLAQVAKVSRILGEGSRDENSFFRQNQTPHEVLIEIAKAVVDPKLIYEKEAGVKAHRNFNKPQSKK